MLHRTESTEYKKKINKFYLKYFLNLYLGFCFVVDDLQTNNLFKERLSCQESFESHVSKKIEGNQKFEMFKYC